MNITVRGLMRLSKELHITPGRAAYNCVGGILSASVGIKFSNNHKLLALKTGHSIADILALELGYAGWDYNRWDNIIRCTEAGNHVSRTAFDKICKNRYYKVGQNFAKLVQEKRKSYEDY